MKNRKRQINQTFFRIFLAFALLFIVLLSSMVTWQITNQKKLSTEYLTNNMSRLESNLNGYFSDIHKMGYGLSINWSFISLYADETYIDPSISYQNAAQLASYICSYNPSISDILVIDTQGGFRSFFSGSSYDIIPSIAIANLFYDPSNISRDFYFFPEDSSWSQSYFIYYAPIFNMSNMPEHLDKSASAIFLCNKKKLNELLDYNPENANGEYYAIYYRDDFIISNTGEKSDALTSEAITMQLPLSIKDLTLVGINNHPYYGQNKNQLLMIGLIVFLASFCLIVILIICCNRLINKPIWNIRRQLASFKNSDLNGHIQETNIKELDDIVVDINAMIDKLKHITKTIFSTQDTLYETQLRKTEAELYALQSQINPHFLYNTLQCIYGLASSHNYESIKEVSLNLSDVFQYSILPGDFVRCEEEILTVYKYLHIYKLRFKGNLDYHIDIPDDVLECKTIKMMIQPIIENSILHGYKMTDRLPVLHINALREADDVIFQIIDNGTGISGEKLKQINTLLQKSFSESIHEKNASGLGLYNINRRICLTFGEKYGLSIHSNINGTEVSIRIPFSIFPSNSDPKLLT